MINKAEHQNTLKLSDIYQDTHISFENLRGNPGLILKSVLQKGVFGNVKNSGILQVMGSLAIMT